MKRKIKTKRYVGYVYFDWEKEFGYIDRNITNIMAGEKILTLPKIFKTKPPYTYRKVEVIIRDIREKVRK